MKVLVAAAIQVGDTIVLEREGHRDEVKVKAVHNSAPVGGRITWDTTGGELANISAVARFQVVELV